jgi:hypothetical protein
MEIKGKAGGYIQSTLKAIKSWLSFNGIEIRRKLKVKRANDTPTLRGNQRLPVVHLLQIDVNHREDDMIGLCVK